MPSPETATETPVWHYRPGRGIGPVSIGDSAADHAELFGTIRHRRASFGGAEKRFYTDSGIAVRVSADGRIQWMSVFGGRLVVFHGVPLLNRPFGEVVSRLRDVGVVVEEADGGAGCTAAGLAIIGCEGETAALEFPDEG